MVDLVFTVLPTEDKSVNVVLPSVVLLSINNFVVLAIVEGDTEEIYSPVVSLSTVVSVVIPVSSSKPSTKESSRLYAALLPSIA